MEFTSFNHKHTKELVATLDKLMPQLPEQFHRMPITTAKFSGGLLLDFELGKGDHFMVQGKLVVHLKDGRKDYCPVYDLDYAPPVSPTDSTEVF